MDTIPLRSSEAHHVQGVAVGDGFVWATDADGVAKIDPRTNSVVNRVPLANSGGHLAFGFGKLWAEDTGSYTNSVWVIDPHSGTVIGHRGLQPYGGSAYAMGHGTVWAMDPYCCAPAGVDSVWRLSPHGSQQTSQGSYQVLARIPNVGNVAIGAEGVWEVLDGHIGNINPRTNKVRQLPTVMPGAHTIAVGGGAVWVVSDLTATVAELNPANGDPIAPPIHIGKGFEEFPLAAIQNGVLWICDVANPALVRIDIATRMMRRIRLPQPPAGIAVDGNSIWVTFSPAVPPMPA
jgi:streptogramin lyase